MVSSKLLRAKAIEVVFALAQSITMKVGGFNQYFVALVTEQIATNYVEHVQAILDVLRKANQVANFGRTIVFIFLGFYVLKFHIVKPVYLEYSTGQA